MVTALIVALAAQAPPGVVATRYEMGERVKALDRVWLATPDKEKRGKAVPAISGAVMSFFSQQFGRACQSLDQAKAALEGRPASAADAVNVRVFPLVVGDNVTPKVKITWAYVDPSWGPVTVGLGRAKVEVKPGEAAELEVNLSTWLPNAKPTIDEEISLPVTIAGQQRPAKMNMIKNFEARAAKLAASKNPVAKNLGEFVKNAAQGGETDFSIASALVTAEKLDAKTLDLKEIEQIPYATFNGSVLRAAIPRKAEGEVTVVLALHGAGGSENFFFEGYGAGIGMREALKRGWVFIAPRAGSNSSQNALDWVTQVRGLKIKRLLVMGHSMGGGMALASGTLKPKPAAVALFAPASRGVPADLAGVPIFLAVGKQEIGMLRQGAMQLKQAMEGKAGFQFMEFDPCEHLMIVADAIPGAYKFYDGIMGA